MSTSFVSHSIVGEVKPEDLLPMWAYFVVIFVYLTTVIFAAILIDDLTLIFGIIAGLAECTTVFILPSIFYLIASHKERKEEAEYLAAVQAGKRLPRKPRAKKGGSPLILAAVYVYLSLGVVYFCVSNYFNFAKILR